VISSGKFRIGGWVGMERKSCSNGWGWKSDAAGTDTTGAVMDGDGLISHYCVGLYNHYLAILFVCCLY